MARNQCSEKSVFGEDASAAEGPGERGPVAFDVMKFAEHGAAPISGVRRRDLQGGLQ